MNETRDAINAAELAPAPGYRLKSTSNGTSLEILTPKIEEPGPSSSVQQYKVTAIFDDYVEAKTWDGTNLGSSVTRIAKPWRLRKTGWDGVTVTYNFNGMANPIRYVYSATPGYRTATHLTSLAIENQAIIPVYSLADILYATEPEDGTLVSGATWLDLNVDARAWARY